MCFIIIILFRQRRKYTVFANIVVIEKGISSLVIIQFFSYFVFIFVCLNEHGMFTIDLNYIEGEVTIFSLLNCIIGIAVRIAYLTTNKNFFVPFL